MILDTSLPFIMFLLMKFDISCRIESSGGQLNLREKSELIEALVQQNQLTEATRLTRDMLVAGAHPIPRIFKYLINELAKGGDVENLTSFGKYISEVSLSQVVSISYIFSPLIVWRVGFIVVFSQYTGVEFTRDTFFT